MRIFYFTTSILAGTLLATTFLSSIISQPTVAQTSATPSRSTCSSLLVLTKAEFQPFFREYSKEFSQTWSSCLVKVALFHLGRATPENVQDGGWGMIPPLEEYLKTYGITTAVKDTSWVLITELLLAGLAQTSTIESQPDPVANAIENAPSTPSADLPSNQDKASDASLFASSNEPTVVENSVPEAPAILPPVPRPKPGVPLESVSAEATSTPKPAGKCQDISVVKDPDVRRNAKALLSAGICMTRHVVKERGKGTRWVFYVFENTKRPNGPAWFIPHDNENSAFSAGVHAITRYGGKLIAVAASERRIFVGIDPNRNFALQKSKMIACRMKNPTPNFTNFVMNQFAGRRVILTLHNNTNGGSVSAARSGAKTRGFLTTNPNGFRDPDHLVYVASTRSYESNKAGRREVQRLLNLGMNVVYERVSKGNNDCSMSNFIVLERPSLTYYNIEAQHGATTVQKGMVDRMMVHLGVR